MLSLLRQLGVRKGDRVVVQVDKSIEAVLLYLACLRAGAIYIPLNTAYTPSEVNCFLGDATPQLFVCMPAMQDELTTLANSCGVPAVLSLGGAGDSEPFAALEHVHGHFVALHCALLGGSRVIFMARYDTATVMRKLPEATVMMGVPTFYTRRLDQQDFSRQTCANMRLFISGSAPLLAETHREFEARSGHCILERYGMTETGMIISNPYDGERLAGKVSMSIGI